MKSPYLSPLASILFASLPALLPACEVKINNDPAFTKSPSLKIKSVAVDYVKDLDLMVFSMNLDGPAGKTVPKAAGQLDGAPVMAYVFPTSLKAADVGMGNAEGIVALAITSHPDFDDTPLWDEDANGKYDDDKVIYHTHWALLTKDDRVPGGLAVKEFKKEDKSVVLPPTNCGMPMYLDAAGHSVVERGNTIKALVPAYYLRNKTSFKFDGVTCYMQVNTSCMAKPMLGVYEVYSVASGNLSLPYSTAAK
ncbi:hypothetical protein [Luteolibacter luteus]|uniref:hypothetical protein n=1 Tax=Luteolibacter luteus TaxID=2728835 RepID=UPI00197C90D4|nr:hypothetical protein [Luteolibacter luteus]